MIKKSPFEQINSKWIFFILKIIKQNIQIIFNKIYFLLNIIKIYVKLILIKVNGGLAVDINNIPNWILALENEDLEFVKNLVLHSGSLKEIAKVYEVSYPTVRLKLDRLIDKIKMNDAVENEEFIKFIKSLSIDDRISVEDAKLIIEKYKQERDEK